jgi:undecaprenyl-diphosphatase
VNDLLAALLLGILEGLTEFLPISSTGHLLIAQHWLGPKSDLFTIVIQSGAILAIALVFRERLLGLAAGWRQAESRDYLLKLALAFAVTAIVGLPVRLLGWELPETVAPVALALILGGIAMLAIERVLAHRPGQTHIGWNVAMWVGLAQVVAGVFPGTSRSAAAIFAAMLAGALARPAAAEFAFLVGIPTMFAASAFAVLEYATDAQAPREDWAALAVAFAAAALTGFAVVRWLMAWIKAHSFAPFAWYRIALGVLLLIWLGR